MIKILSGDTICSSNIDKTKLSFEIDHIIMPYNTSALCF